jgi:hypothetical protein
MKLREFVQPLSGRLGNDADAKYDSLTANVFSTSIPASSSSGDPVVLAPAVPATVGSGSGGGTVGGDFGGGCSGGG